MLLIIVGTMLSVIFVSKVMRSIDNFSKNWALPKYRPLGTGEPDEERKTLVFDDYDRRKSIAKYFVIAITAILITYFLYDMLSVYRVLTSAGASAEPEYSTLWFDLGVRHTIFAALLMAPFAIFVLLYMLLFSPRTTDLEEMAESRSGMKRRTKQQWEITKAAYQKLTKQIMSGRFLVFCILMFSAFFFIVYSVQGNLQIISYSLAAFVALLGIAGGYLMWSSFHEACFQAGVGSSTIHRRMKQEFLDSTLSSFVIVGTISPVLLFVASNWWQTFIYQAVISPVNMLHGWTPISLNPVNEMEAVLGISLICLVLVIIGFLFFILFPFIYKEGRHGVVVASITFALTFITENIVTTIFQTTTIQPLTFATPLVASIVSYFTQSHYEKLVRKKLPRTLKEREETKTHAN